MLDYHTHPHILELDVQERGGEEHGPALHVDDLLDLSPAIDGRPDRLQLHVELWAGVKGQHKHKYCTECSVCVCVRVRILSASGPPLTADVMLLSAWVDLLPKNTPRRPGEGREEEEMKSCFILVVMATHRGFSCTLT